MLARMMPLRAAALLALLAPCLASCDRRPEAGGSIDLWKSSTIYQAKQRGKLVVLMEAAFKPFTYKEKGELVGFDVDLAKEIAKELKVEVEFRELGFGLLATELVQGKGDLVISGITATAYRALEASFTDPYFLTRTIALLAVPKANGVEKVAQLNDPARRIVAQKSSTGENAAKRHLPKARLDTFEDESLCALEVAQGRADAFIYDELQVRAQAAEHPDSTRVLDDTLSIEPYAIECRKGDPETLSWLNLVLSLMRRDGRLDDLYKKHLPGIKPPSGN
jgi:polar amino acid transport system substrate-binding protein